MLDEPTSGLDPIVRREFIQTVIGAYQDGEPGRRTVFVSTHLISEFEGLIDEFTIIDRGREVLTLEADAARERYQKIYARFAGEPAALDLAGARVLRQQGREIEVVVNGNAADVDERAAGAFAGNADERSADARRDLRRHAAAAARCRMMPAMPMRALVANETRALLPTWIGCVVAGKRRSAERRRRAADSAIRVLAATASRWVRCRSGTSMRIARSI